MSRYFVEAEMLGNLATSADAERMVELLRERGINAAAGSPLSFSHEPEECPDAIWEECLDILSREKYT